MFIVIVGNPFEKLLVARGPFETEKEAKDWMSLNAWGGSWVTEVLSQDVPWKVQVKDGICNFIFECYASSYDNAVQLAKEEHPKATIVEAWEIGS